MCPWGVYSLLGQNNKQIFNWLISLKYLPLAGGPKLALPVPTPPFLVWKPLKIIHWNYSNKKSYIFPDPHELPKCLPFPPASPWRPFLSHLGELRIPHFIHMELSLENFPQKTPKVQLCPFYYLMSSSTNISWRQLEFTSIWISCEFQTSEFNQFSKTTCNKKQLVYFKIPL